MDFATLPPFPRYPSPIDDEAKSEIDWRVITGPFAILFMRFVVSAFAFVMYGGLCLFCIVRVMVDL